MTPPVRSKPRWGRRALWLSLLVIALGLVKFVMHLVLPRNFSTTGETLHLELKGGPQKVPYFCLTQEPRGIVIVGSGDGGWSYWEDKTAKHLALRGYAVGGWDCRTFADSRHYDAVDLTDGMEAAVEAVRARSGASASAPVWYGGWSTGAEQAVAAAAHGHLTHLRGLWLAAPGERGRFGITTGDLLGKTPTGPDTFALAEFSSKLKETPIIQFVAGLDPLDDTTLFDNYRGPKRRVDMPRLLHDMGGAGPAFQAELEAALLWSLKQNP